MGSVHDLVQITRRKDLNNVQLQTVILKDDLGEQKVPVYGPYFVP